MGTKKTNKVKFNLKNVHIAPINRETGEYGEIFKLPGAVNLSLEAQGDIEKFYADGVVYFQCAPNNGYEGDLEIALVTDEFRQKILKERLNAENVMTENVEDDFNDFAMGFQIDGDIHNTLFWYYNCTATRPSTEAATNEDSKTPQTDTLSISCTCDENGNVRSKTTADTSDEVRAAWFKSVYKELSPALRALSVEPMSDGDQALDKPVSELQADVQISSNNRITGTLLHVADYTGYSKSNNTGNFLALAVSYPEDATVKVSMIGGESQPKTMTDHILVAKVASTAQKIKLEITRGQDSGTVIYDLSGLTLKQE